jgi:D-arabinose 1-dehydrogenase-like Zn-dependent alcohol dehydrogenase
MIYNGILFTTKAVEFLVTKGKEKGLKVAAKELVAKLLDTAATTTNAVAKVFNAEASKGLAGIIAGALAAAIIVGTIAMVASTVATNKNTEKKQKAAEASAEQAEKEAELAEKIREEYDSLIELT